MAVVIQEGDSHLVYELTIHQSLNLLCAASLEKQRIDFKMLNHNYVSLRNK